jgi:hypothetical protein
MSNIPKARECLVFAIQELDPAMKNFWIRRALALMSRERPKFKCPATVPPLTEHQKHIARLLRDRHMPLNDIAQQLQTNIGRVSEAIND